MSRWSGRWPWAALLGAAVVIGVATGTGTADDSPIPSISNPGTKGARVLHTWLAERGTPVQTLLQPLTTIPAGVQALVIGAPAGRSVTTEETEALARFVDAGGTLVYLSPRPASVQPAMKKWLKLSDSTAPFPATALSEDVGGLTVAVDPQHAALLPGVGQLRVAADTGIEVDQPDAVRVAGSSLWALPRGKGQVWIAAGPDLIENRRLDLLDNLKLWAALGAMRIAFDEHHHGAWAAPLWSANLWASLLQFIFVALLFVAARAPRLGPARPTPGRSHRSTLEYVTSMGAQMQRAGVETELKQKQRERLRRLMHERLGIAVALGADEASRILAGHTGMAADAWLQLDRRLSDPHADFLAASADAARLEDLVLGRR